jgi:hypothetical protein
MALCVARCLSALILSGQAAELVQAQKMVPSLHHSTTYTAATAPVHRQPSPLNRGSDSNDADIHVAIIACGKERLDQARVLVRSILHFMQ